MSGVIIVLGAPNDAEGNLSSIALERCCLALSIFRQNPSRLILPTGGFGSHFNTSSKPHAFYTRAFLLAKGVPPERILEGDYSRYTLEDAELAKPIVDRYGVRDLSIVTSDFHLERVKVIFDRVFEGYTLGYLGSKTHLPSSEWVDLVAHEMNALSKLMTDR